MSWRAGALVLALGSASLAPASTVFSPTLQVDGDDTNLIFGVGTAPSYSPASASLTYSSPGPSGTSHIVIWANGTPYDLQDATTRAIVSPMTAVGSGTGAYVQATYDLTALPLRVTVHYEITDDPQSVVVADTMKVRVSVQNMGASVITYGVRLMFDTQINGNDGANISIDNGFSVVGSNTLYTQSSTGVPLNWWGYDVAPPGTPNLVGRGSLYGNPRGEAATQPDAMEIADWGSTENTAQWTVATAGMGIGDSSVVVWWTGTGTAGIPSLTLAPGASRSFVTYYGVNGGTLLNTFTSTPVPGTPTITPTVTPTFSVTQTFSVSPSFSVSPTFSVTPTITLTRTLTPTLTLTNTFSITQTFSVSPTFSVTPTISFSPTFSMTSTITPTLTPTPRPLQLKLLPANPDPAATEAWLPYFLSTDADVDIQVWTVAGEKVRGWTAGWRLAGYREERWDLMNEAANKVGSGIFIYRIRARSPAGEEKFDFAKCAVSR